MSETERGSALFAMLVQQQANMALVFLGHGPHPETGESKLDLETARVFVDQLEVLQEKTRGNLAPDEEGFLKECLMTVRMAFVEATNKTKNAPASSTPPTETFSPPPAAPAPKAASSEEPKPAPSSDEDPSRKKFSKKY